MSGRLFVVVNPAAGKGRGRELIEPVRAALGTDVALRATERPGDETAIVAQAIRDGFDTIVAVGGDGTWSLVADAIIRSRVPAALGLVGAGTGCDFAKTFGIPSRDVAAAAQVIRDGHLRIVDVGRVEDRHFLNVAGFGFDIAVIEDSQSVRWLRGDLVYIYCALRQLWRYPGFDVEIGMDGGPSVRRDELMLIVANARVFGGGFKIASMADLSDGQLDAVSFANTGFWRRLNLMARLLRGAHWRQREVSHEVSRAFRLKFSAPPVYETDGELNYARSSELTIEAVPAAIRVLVPKS